MARIVQIGRFVWEANFGPPWLTSQSLEPAPLDGYIITGLSPGLDMLLHASSSLHLAPTHLFVTIFHWAMFGRFQTELEQAYTPPPTRHSLIMSSQTL